MFTRVLVIVTVLLNYLVLLTQAATITLYTPVVVLPTPGPSVVYPTSGVPPILTVSAVDVLPGNITEYAIPFTIQEGGGFIGNIVSFAELIPTGTSSAVETLTIPVTGAVGCTVTAPPSATETQFHCAQVLVFNGTSKKTMFYSATASPIYTFTEPTPPPTASATTGVLFPSGVPTGNTNGSKQLQTRFGDILLALSVISGLFIL